ncbi:MAG: serine protease, partial [Verrucomicrobiales bacterium]
MKRSPIFALIAAAATAAAPSISFAEAPASPLLQRQAKVQQTARESGRAVVAILPGRGGAGMGSGVVVSKDGIILTAAHVLRAVGERFRVIFPDGTEAEARALGANFDRDAAMAKIATQREGEGGWPFAPLAPSASVVPGEWCVAMGHPGGYEAERPPPVRVGRVWKQSEPGFLLS